MDDTRAISERPRWDEIEIKGPGRRVSLRRASRRTWLGNAILIVGAAAGHAAIGYFGYQWIRNNQAPTFSETLPATSKRADEISETTIHERDKPEYKGKMPLKRSEEINLAPSPRNIDAMLPGKLKCVAGIAYTTRTGADGSTIIELVTIKGRPATCSVNG
ncbi:MAG TPA: hypothetical protein PLY87_10145 [Planctomycetaceae bacterium]|nr:hypothetical protein [Planctomycetaceae bacterium]